MNAQQTQEDVLAEHIVECLMAVPPVSKSQKYFRKLSRWLQTIYPNLGRRSIMAACRGYWRMLNEAYPLVPKILVRHRRLQAVLRIPGATAAQRTDDWHKLRRNAAITGSVVYEIINTPGSYHNALLNKLQPPPRSDLLNETPEACRHGIIFEDMAKDVYCKWYGVRVQELSCIPHKKYPELLGASPDGVVLCDGVPLLELNEHHGRAIEIKCPLTRQIKEGVIPPGYYHQMQLQMEVLGVDECNYLEFAFDTNSVGTMADFLEAHVDGGLAGGNILAKGYYVLDETCGRRVSYKCFYTDAEVSEPELHALASRTDVHVTYWVLRKFLLQVIPLDKDWLPKHMPVFERFAADLTKHRADKTLPDAPAALQERRTRAARKVIVDMRMDLDLGTCLL